MPVLLDVFKASSVKELKNTLSTIPIDEFHEIWAKITEMKINVEPTFDNDFFKGKLKSQRTLTSNTKKN